MSEFSAGSIVGKLGLDVSEYAEGMRASTSMAGTFAAEIGHIMAECTGSPILGEMANGISEVVAAASEGGWSEAFAAGIHTAGEAVSGLIETLEETTEEFHSTGLAAEKFGVSTEFISTVGRAAKNSGLDIQMMGMNMRMLEDRAANATTGNLEALRAFREVGIGAGDLAELLKDPEKMFYAVADGMAAIPEGSLRVQAATDLMSRSGASMIPFLSKGSAHIKEFAQSISDLGASVSEDDARMAEDFGELQTKFSAVVSGMEMEVTKPILQDIVGDSDTLIADFKSLADTLKTDLPPAIHAVVSEVDSLLHDLGLVDEKVQAINKDTGQKQTIGTSASDYIGADIKNDPVGGKVESLFGWLFGSFNQLTGSNYLGDVPDMQYQPETGGMPGLPGGKLNLPALPIPPGHGPTTRPTAAPPISINNHFHLKAEDMANAAANATRRAVASAIQKQQVAASMGMA